MAQNDKVDLTKAENLDIDSTYFSLDTGNNEMGASLDSFLEDDPIVEPIKKEPAIPTPKEESKKEPIPAKLSEEQQKALEEKKNVEKGFDEFLEEDQENELEIEKPDVKTNPKNKEEETLKDTEDNSIKSFAADLYKINFFTKDSEDEEIPSTQEELLEKLQSEKEKGAEELVDQLAGRHGEKFRKAFYAMFVNGVDPETYIPKYIDSINFKELDLTDEDNQVKVVEAGYRKQGWEEEDIREEIKRLKTNSDLESVSTRFHKALVKLDEQELLKTEENAKIEAQKAERLENLYKQNLGTILQKGIKDKEIEGIPVTKELANKAFDMAYTKKWTLPGSKDGLTDLDAIFLELNKPQNHAVKAAIAVLFAQTFEGFGEGKTLSLDFSKIQKKAVSTESSELFHSLIRNKQQTGKISKNNTSSNVF